MKAILFFTTTGAHPKQTPGCKHVLPSMKYFGRNQILRATEHALTMATRLLSAVLQQGSSSGVLVTCSIEDALKLRSIGVGPRHGFNWGWDLWKGLQRLH